MDVITVQVGLLEGGAGIPGTPPKPEARGGSREEKLQAVAVQAQEGLEELSHVEGQEGRQPRGATPRLHGQHMRKSEYPIVIREFSLKS